MLIEIIKILLLLITGYCLGSLIFYFTPRFIFHGKLGKLPILKMLRKIHTIHHANPHDLEKAFFPNWSKPIIGTVMIGVGFLNLPLAIGVCSFFPVYAYRHWKAHNGSDAYFARHHMNYHLKNPRANFGGIYPVVDVIFRTNDTVKNSAKQIM